MFEQVMPHYETTRLLLRPFEYHDADAFLKMISDPDVIKYIGGDIDPNLSTDEVIKLMDIAPIGDYKAFGYGRHAMVDKLSGDIIGFTGIKYMPEHDLHDIGYRMFKPYWGKGLATESCWPMLHFAFKILKLSLVTGMAMPDNKASCRVLEKIGLEYIDQRLYDETLVSYYELSQESYGVLQAGQSDRFLIVND